MATRLVLVQSSQGQLAMFACCIAVMQAVFLCGLIVDNVEGRWMVSSLLLYHWSFWAVSSYTSFSGSAC